MASNDADWTLSNSADREQAVSAGDLRLLQPGLLQRMESIGSKSSVNSTGSKLASACTVLQYCIVSCVRMYE